MNYSPNGTIPLNHSVSFGNPNLKADTGDDIDLLLGYYMPTFGIVSAGYFYKSLPIR